LSKCTVKIILLIVSNLLGMIAAMHDITRHRELVVKKPPKGSEKGEIMDPNSFPI